MVMTDTRHHAFVQAHTMYDAKSKPYCKLYTGGDDDVPTRVHHLQHMWHLVGMLTTGTGVLCGAGGT